MNIQKLMNKPAVTCRASDSANTAAQLMWDHDCGAMPVVDDDGKIVGMITDRDICMAAYTQGSLLSDIPVSAAMAQQVFSCHIDDSLEAVETLMSGRQIRRIPIVDSDSRPIGVLSLTDIARHAASTQDKNGLDRRVSMTLTSICQPQPQAQPEAKPKAQPPGKAQRQSQALERQQPASLS